MTMPDRFHKNNTTDKDGNLKAGYQAEEPIEDSTTNANVDKKLNEFSDPATDVANPLSGDSNFDPPEAAQS